MNRAELEAVLAEAYRQQAACYASALALTAATDVPADARLPWLPRLHELMAEIAAIEVRIAGPRAAWQRLATPPGPILRDCLARVGEHLRKLSAVVEHVTNTLEDRKQRVMPELEDILRFQQMQQAYGKFARAAGS